MKAVDLLINSYLPEDLRSGEHTFDKKGIKNILSQIALKYPDKYRKISKQVSDAGRMASYIQGETITLSDMRPVIDKDAVLAQMKLEVSEAVKKVPAKDRKAVRMGIYGKYANHLQKATMSAISQLKHGIGDAVISGSRGNPTQFMGMVTTPAMYTDYKDKPIDLFVNNSFGEGLSPAEYLASMYGARKSVIATKEATRDAGDLGKQMVQAATNQVVTQNSCTCSNGIAVELDDVGNLDGRVLVNNYGNAKAGTVVDGRVIRELQKSKVSKVMVRSPLTCQAKQGVCSDAAGADSTGKLPSIGDAVGVTATQALSEPIAQGALNTKHTGGQVSTDKAGDKGTANKVFAGFGILNQIMQAPGTFPNRAVVSEVFGNVESVEEAPQGGNYITIAGQPHYSLPGFELFVKRGDKVEPGDQLGDGIVDVKDIIRLKGLGAGRKYYVDRLYQAYKDSGLGVQKRNLEFLARGALDHIRVEDVGGIGDYLPDDLASYNSLSSDYQPAKDTVKTGIDNSSGKYLQVPALHYTIGTRLSPNMVKDLKDSGIDNVYVSNQEPKFVPVMSMLRRSTKHNTDWLAKMHASYLKDTLRTDAISGQDTNVEKNVHFAPRISIGSNFGDDVKKTGLF
jgi:hypothetical protein